MIYPDLVTINPYSITLNQKRPRIMNKQYIQPSAKTIHLAAAIVLTGSGEGNVENKGSNKGTGNNVAESKYSDFDEE